MTRLFETKMERTHLGGGIELLTLTATKVSALEHRQGWSAVVAEGDIQSADRRLGALFDVLVERCGAERVVEAHPLASHVPERAFRTGPLVASRCPPSALITPADRPSVLYERPEPAEAIALLPDGPPSWLRWRREEVRVVSAHGPERIGAPWWDGRHPSSRCVAYRDYFKVQDERGRWLWVFRGTENGHWFVHGEWA